MTINTTMRSRTDYELSKLTDEEVIDRYFERDFSYDSLAGLTDNELDDRIDHYIGHLPETHGIPEEEIPSTLSSRLKILIRNRI
jgi:hypothetical protein